jgi:hypothetical protein
MATTYEPYVERRYDSADELWDALSPTRELVPEPSELIFRGQADARWGLVPSALRTGPASCSERFWGSRVTFDGQVFVEIKLLEMFAQECDRIGVAIPGDSGEFRRTTLTAATQDRFFIDPSRWPDPQLLDVMAFAQHHGVPTRLLDWTRQPHVAAYFAASSSLSSPSTWGGDGRLAIWALNISRLGLHARVKVARVPGSISPHLSAQSGLFTVHPGAGARGEILEVSGLEAEFAMLPDTPLVKLTLPTSQTLRLFQLCEKAGLTAATIYRSADGAGKAVADSVKGWVARRSMLDGPAATLQAAQDAASNDDDETA